MGFENWCILDRQGNFYITNEYMLSGDYSLVLEPNTKVSLARCESTWVKHKHFRVSFWFSFKFSEAVNQEGINGAVGFKVFTRFGVVYLYYVWSEMYFSIKNGYLYFIHGSTDSFYGGMDVQCDTLERDLIVGPCPNYDNNTWGFIWFDVCNPKPHKIVVEGYIVPCVEKPIANNPPYNLGIKAVRCVGESTNFMFMQSMGYGIGLTFENWRRIEEYNAKLIIDYIQIQIYEHV